MNCTFQLPFFQDENVAETESCLGLADKPLSYLHSGNFLLFLAHTKLINLVLKSFEFLVIFSAMIEK